MKVPGIEDGSSPDPAKKMDDTFSSVTHNGPTTATTITATNNPNNNNDDIDDDDVHHTTTPFCISTSSIEPDLSSGTIDDWSRTENLNHTAYQEELKETPSDQPTPIATSSSELLDSGSPSTTPKKSSADSIDNSNTNESFPTANEDTLLFSFLFNERTEEGEETEKSTTATGEDKDKPPSSSVVQGRGDIDNDNDEDELMGSEEEEKKMKGGMGAKK